MFEVVAALLIGWSLGNSMAEENKTSSYEPNQPPQVTIEVDE